MSKFLFYGCWNNIDCDKEYVYRDLILSYINKKEKGLSTFFIAGDNWYSTKLLDTNKITTQYYLLSILKTGYDKIYSLNKTIHVAAGNHDEEEDGEISPINIKDRCMIKTQKKYIDTLNESNNVRLNKSNDVSLNYSKDPMSYDKYLQSSDETTSSSFINSDFKGFQTTLEELNEIKNIDIHDKTINIYVDDIGIVKYKKYIVIIINTNKLNNEDYINNIETKFKEISDENKEDNKQIFVMGHVPLFPIKKDKIKKKNKDPLFEKGDRLFDLLATYKYIYICADSHYFSIMDIKKEGKTVIQITSGTGGADPDINTEKYDDTMNIKINKYDINYYLLNSYGYSTIGIYKKKIIIIYKKILNANNSDDKISNKGGNVYIYSIQRDNGNIKFEKTESINKVFSDEKLKQYKHDKNLTCNYINNQMLTIQDNVVTSNDKKTFCYKKVKDK